MHKAYDWKKKLAHERVCRDAIVACGNPAPKQSDPEGGLYTVVCLKFNGKVYFAHLKENGHNATDFNTCVCNK